MKNTPEKILIIRLSSIGDILLSTPFIRQTRKRFPESQIDFVIKDKFYSLISENPYLSNIFQLKSGQLKHLINAIRSEKYDYIFDLHSNIRSFLLSLGAGSGKVKRIKKNKVIQQTLVKFKINLYASEKPIPDRYLDVGYPNGVRDDYKGLEFFWDQKAELQAKRYMTESRLINRKMHIALAPGAGFYTKRWPTDFFYDLMEKIQNKYNAGFVILGDQRDLKTGRELARDREWVLDLTGRIGLMEAGAIISNCGMAITNDSGMMHLATAVKTPVMAIFGSSVKEFGFFPYRGKSEVVERNELNCRPCSHIGRKSCPRGHFKCMLDLTPTIVMKRVENFITGLKSN